MAATFSTSQSFSSGDSVTSAKLNNIVSGLTMDAGTLADADVSSSAAIAPSKLDVTAAFNMGSGQIGGTTFIDGSRNLTNIGTVSCGSITSSGTVTATSTISGSSLSITGDCTFGNAGTYTNLYSATTRLGENSGDTIECNGTFTGSPAVGAATPDFSNDALLGIDASNSNALAKFNLTTFQQLLKVAIVSDTQSDGTAGGTPTAGAWTKRVMATEVDASSIVSVSSSVLTPVSGTYLAIISGAFYYTNHAQIRLRKTSATAATVVTSPNVFFNSSGLSKTITGVGLFTAGGSDTYELQYYCGSAAGGANGLGYPNSNGESEVHAQVTLIKIA